MFGTRDGTRSNPLSSSSWILLEHTRRNHHFGSCGMTVDHFAILGHRLIDGLKHLYHAQPGPAVIKWGLAVQNAFREILHLESQSLHLFNARCPQITGAITDSQVVTRTAVVGAI